MRRRLGFVTIPAVAATVTEELRPAELHEALRNFIVDRAALPDDSLHGEALSNLIERALAIAGHRH